MLQYLEIFKFYVIKHREMQIFFMGEKQLTDRKTVLGYFLGKGYFKIRTHMYQVEDLTIYSFPEIIDAQ